MGVIKMYKRFQERLDELFEDAPQTNRAVYQIKELEPTDIYICWLHLFLTFVYNLLNNLFNII